MPKRRKLPPVDEACYEVNSSITRAVAVRLISHRLQSKLGLTFQSAKDRVSKRITAAIEKTKLRESSPRQFVYGELIRWARGEKGWAGIFDGLPSAPSVPNLSSAQITYSGYSLAGAGTILPADLAECQRLCADLLRQLVNAQRELRAALDEVRRLKPNANKWERFVESARKNGAGRKTPK